ncbi:MAG: amidophosphoribosyltransferase [Armatimonadetes bacterium]|nr:amidophosphoribosyltransferase [Candidatus Hippobium faecium]
MEYFHSNKLNDKCGIFGIYTDDEDVARWAYFGLFSLQHRGQQSAGISVTNGKRLKTYKESGLVSQVFNEKTLAQLKGNAAIAHTRYSAKDANVERACQPVVDETQFGVIALGYNGDIINAEQLYNELAEQGYVLDRYNDTDLFISLMKLSGKDNIIDAISYAMSRIVGGYSCILLTKDSVVAFRDPVGIRPLCMGILQDKYYCFSSESCAFHTIGAQLVREIMPGEVMIADKDGLHTYQYALTEKSALCIFEYVYIARPDTNMCGRSIHEARRRMGHELQKEHPITGCDVVFGIPDTGTPAAIGLSEASGVRYGEGVIKNRYIFRTFIQPTQEMREYGVKMKLLPITETIKGKKICMVEDSIVRGTTIKQVVKLFKEAGAAEVHVRIASPPYMYPCFYGIDTANQDHLVAAHKSIEEIRKDINADSLGYLSLEGLIKGVGVDDHGETLCHACLSGQQPIEVPKEILMKKLSKKYIDKLT